MSKLTVKILADQLQKPVEDILGMMKAAGLNHIDADEAVSADDKKALAHHLVKVRTAGSSEQQARGRQRNTVVQGGRAVDVQVRRRRVTRKTPAAAASAAPATDDLEAHRRRAAEEQSRRREEEAREQAESQKRREAKEQQDQKEKQSKANKKDKKGERDRAVQKTAEQPEAQTAAPSARRKADGRAGIKAPKRRSSNPLIGEDGRRSQKQRTVKQALIDSSVEKSSSAEKPAAPRPATGPLKADEIIQKFVRPTEKIVREVSVGDDITLLALARQLSVKIGVLLQLAEKFGLTVEAGDTVDYDTAKVLAEELGHRAVAAETASAEHAMQAAVNTGGAPLPRPPVVTVMGHVDHGKTSLLDYIRRTQVAAEEAGGITQRIGAYRVHTERGNITFIDTPGHAAFSAMRARGAQCTDVVVLMAAADDGVMPQTLEAVQHARAAAVPIVVAVNKMDREDADPEKVRRELAAAEVVPEDWGGDVQYVHISALNGDGVEQLLEAVLLQAELLELQAPRDTPATGVILETRLDKGRGPVTSLLVQTGTLRVGDILLAGACYGRVRGMTDENGKQIKEALPSAPVEMVGMRAIPEVGCACAVVQDEQQAREIASLYTSGDQRPQQAPKNLPAEIENIEDAFSHFTETDARKEANLVLKADTQGSLEALRAALSDLSIENAEVRLLLAGIGAITESDISLAVSSGAAVFGFNVRADATARRLAEAEGVDVRYYNVIYAVLDDTRQIMEGLLVPEPHENIVGIAEVREVFRASKYGQAAGCMVREGIVHRDKPIRILRDNIVIFEGALDSLRRFKGDVAEVRSGTECGIGVQNYSDIRVGDLIEVFEGRKEERASRTS